jgi:hypothetical protein
VHTAKARGVSTHAGVHDLIEEQTLKEGEVDGTPGLDLIASHFAKVIEVS